MKQYEYRVLKYERGVPPHIPIEDRLNAMGADGWLLVGYQCDPWEIEFVFARDVTPVILPSDHPLRAAGLETITLP